MSTEPITVMITGMGSTTALSVLKGLRRQSDMAVRIVGVDINKAEEIAGSSFCDAFFTVPLARDPAYIDTLVELCRAERVRVLFPINDLEVSAVAAHAARFREAGVMAWVSDSLTVVTCNDKLLTARFCVANDITAPSTWGADELPASLDRLPYPLIIKPRSGVGSVGVARVDTPGELQAMLRHTPHAVIQRNIEGPEYTVDVVCDQAGRVLAAVPRERIEVKAGISYKGRTLHHPALEERARTIAATLGIRGPCNVQFRVEQGTPYLIEVNPRFSAALPLTIAAGVNSPLIFVRLAIGEQITEPLQFQPEVYMARYWEEVFYGSDRSGKRAEQATGS
jgi:carbamoyl-phosphate synthase large subunit